MDLTILGAAIAAGIITLATAIGIGKIGSNALQSIARQPEAGDKIRNAMILACALIEGIAIICAIICLLIVVTK